MKDHICYVRQVGAWGGFPRYEICTHDAKGAFPVVPAGVGLAQLRASLERIADGLKQVHDEDLGESVWVAMDAEECAEIARQALGEQR